MLSTCPSLMQRCGGPAACHVTERGPRRPDPLPTCRFHVEQTATNIVPASRETIRYPSTKRKAGPERTAALSPRSLDILSTRLVRCARFTGVGGSVVRGSDAGSVSKGIHPDAQHVDKASFTWNSLSDPGRTVTVIHMEPRECG